MKITNNYYKFIGVALLLIPFSAGAFTYNAEVIKVLDGDTVIVNDGKKEHRIRLCGIDAPESKQEHGQWSKNLLQNIVKKFNNKVSVKVMDVDRYGRHVASIGYSNFEFNTMMLEYGGAWVYERYADNCWNTKGINKAKHLAARARESHIGLWENKNSLEPWIWRRQNK